MTAPSDVAVTGLTELAVRARVDAGQVNTVPPAPGRSLAQILRANVLTRFNAILGALFVVVLVIGPPQDALFGAVLVVNTAIGVAQELRAKRALDRLAILTAGRARAIRDGAVTEIPLDRIVLDDVLELSRGDQVPVDGTVLDAGGLELDEALLTGEAKPVPKQPGDTVLSGSAVVAGTGRIRADRVGGDAYAARLQAEARRFSLIRSELQQGTWLLGAPSVVSGGRLPGVVAAAVRDHEAAGRRVLLLASAAHSLDGDRPPAGAEPAALIVLAEELRPDAAASVRYLLEEGITIKVLSGDAPRAVAAIAARAGIPVGGPPRDASTLGQEDIGDVLASANVLGRVRPEQKLAAIKALQAAGHVVAMCGDGVNDVQALKQADLGIAMGTGSQASRSVARVVLLDGTFAAIPPMLAEGRRVVANVERVARLFVTKTVYAAIIAVAVGAAGITYPFFPRHLTIISTLTIGVPGFFLALGRGAPRARPGFTRRVLSFTIPAGVATAAAALASYLIVRSAGYAAASRTAAMLAVFAMGLWVLVLVAGRPAARRIVLIVAMAAGLVPLFAVPLARRVLALQLPPAGTVAAVAGVVLAAITALTLWRRPGRLR